MFRPLPVAVLAAALVASGCVISLGNHPRGIRVRGVRLEEKHQETVVVGPWTEAGLHVESSLGDVRVEPTDGENRILVELWEEVPGDAFAAFEEGHLKARSRSDRTIAVGEVTVYTNASLSTVALSTGMGNVTLQGIPVESSIHLSTGQGDVTLCCAGEPRDVVLSTGMGDIEVATTACRRLEASTGLGDVEVDEVSATEAEISTGLGDVDLESSTFERVEATTGLGDIDCEETSYEKGNLSSGLGSVHRG